MKLADLKLNPDNPRNIKEDKLDKLANSIKDFPKMMKLRPIVYKDGVIIGGNMRYRAIKKLGMTEIPDEWAVDAKDLTDEERHRFIMQDNAEMGEHDWDMVANQYELEDLEAWGIDVPYADVAEEVEEDEAPEVSSEPPVSKLGEVYQLGRHRVMCGDSTEKASVIELLNGTSPRVCLTDPPYGLGEKKQSGKNNYEQYVDTEENLVELAGKWLPVAQELCETVVFSPGINNIYLYPKADWVMCWFYGGGQLKSSWGFNCWQPFLCYGKDPSFAVQKGARPDAVDMNVPANAQDVEHPCPKPVKLMAWFLDRLVFDDTPVYEPFCGGGTTLIACEQTDRTCYGMELDPKYVDVIRKRYAKFINNNELPDNWEELTPAIAREKQDA